MRYSQIRSLDIANGPGTRISIFCQGCERRCKNCFNPETWDFEGGTEYSADALVEKTLRYKTYYGQNGGVTVSGGEPLTQAEFLSELFKKLKKYDVHIALDTSGCILNDHVKDALEYTDMVLLDFKYTNEEDYFKYTQMQMSKAQSFLDYLQENNKRTWIRYVVIPNLNDNDEAVKKIFALKKQYSCIEKIELLPFRKLCIEKYENMGIDFPLKNTPEAKQELIDKLYKDFDK